MLKRRLDNVVYRMGFGATRSESRQLVAHKSILINGKAVNIPSYLVKPSDVVSVRGKSKNRLVLKLRWNYHSNVKHQSGLKLMKTKWKVFSNHYLKDLIFLVKSMKTLLWSFTLSNATSSNYSNIIITRVTTHLERMKYAGF